MHNDSVISAHNLSIGYPNRTLLEGLDLRVERGNCLLIMGHNAVGKTTLLRTLWGEMSPLAGKVDFLDRDPYTLPANSRVRLGVRYLGQGDRQFGELTVRESRAALSRLYGFDLRSPLSEVPGGNPRIKNLSGGQRRWEAIQLLSVGGPKLFVLDEPTAGLDPASALRIVRWVADMRAMGIAFVVAEHRYREWLDIASEALVLRSGSITFRGKPSELRNPELLARVYL